MTGILTKITNAFTGGVIKDIGEVVDRFVQTPEEKAALEAAMQDRLLSRFNTSMQVLSTEMNAKSQVIMAELQQDDKFTKRARPATLYFGLFAIFWNYMLVPTLQLFTDTPPAALPLPAEFWYVWGSFASVYVIGRSREKSGISDKLTNAITGNKKVTLLD